MPKQLSPRPGNSADGATRLTTVTAISFSLTFVVVSIALLAGLLPPRVTTMGETRDLGVLLLFLPLCALAFALIAEVFRTAVSGPLHTGAPRRTQPLSEMRPLRDWHVGSGQG